MEMEDEEEDEEPCGGVALSPVAAAAPAAPGGSAFRGLWESSEMPPFPLPLTAGAVEALAAAAVLPGLWAPVCVCSEDLGEGVAVDMAEMGEEAAELPWACGVDGSAAGWMLLTFLWGSAMVAAATAAAAAAAPPPSASPAASRAESLGLSALRLGFSPPSAAALSSPECRWLARPSAGAALPSAGAGGDGVLASGPPLPRATAPAAVLLSLVADAPGAAPPEVEEEGVGGREGGDGRWLPWAGCRGDGALVECPT